MSPKLARTLAAAVEGMPAFPKSVERILELTRDANCTPKDLVQVIDQDPVLTVKILKVVNSAYYSLPKQIAKKLAFGIGGNCSIDEFPVPVARRLGGSMTDVMISLGDLAPVFDEAKTFSRL